MPSLPAHPRLPSRAILNGILPGLLLSATRLATPGQAADHSEARDENESLYRKCYEAARLKFLDGMLAPRSPEFKAFGADEQEINILGERAMLQAPLTSAMSVEETGGLRSLTQVKGDQVICRVVDRFEVVQFDVATRQTQRLVIITESGDMWVLTPRGWKQVECRIRRQKTNRFPVTE